MNVAFKVETLHASFDNPHHVLVVGVAAVGVSDEPSMQHIGTVRSLGRENRVHSDGSAVVGFIASQRRRLSRGCLGGRKIVQDPHWPRGKVHRHPAITLHDRS